MSAELSYDSDSFDIDMSGIATVANGIATVANGIDADDNGIAADDNGIATVDSAATVEANAIVEAARVAFVESVFISTRATIGYFMKNIHPDSETGKRIALMAAKMEAADQAVIGPKAIFYSAKPCGRGKYGPKHWFTDLAVEIKQVAVPGFRKYDHVITAGFIKRLEMGSLLPLEVRDIIADFLCSPDGGSVGVEAYASITRCMECGFFQKTHSYSLCACGKDFAWPKERVHPENADDYVFLWNGEYGEFDAVYLV